MSTPLSAPVLSVEGSIMDAVCASRKAVGREVEVERGARSILTG